MVNNPLVSVCMITYNHEDYIEQALEGILMQKANFSFELVIGEDGSKDSTLRICKEYEEKYNNIIRLLPTERNLGMLPNFLRTIKACTGKYIALCEGDDYWIDPLKLQKQVDFLEANPEYSMCFHNAVVHYEDIDEKEHLFAQIENRDYTGIEIYRSWIIPTASVVFVQKVIESNLYINYNKIIAHSKYLSVGDLPLFVSASFLGKIRAIPENMSVYRKHIGGIINSFDKNRYDLVISSIIFAKVFGNAFIKENKKHVAKFSVLSFSMLYHGNIKEALKFLYLSFRYTPFYSIKEILIQIPRIILNKLK